MNRSHDARAGLLPEHGALQHERARAPRPLPLFLALLQEIAARDPQLARDALVGLRRYQEAERAQRPPSREEVARVSGACLRDHGGGGPPAVLIPSLINPPHILDLDEQVSLASAIARGGRRVLLLDWGPADARSQLNVARHVEQLLLPLLGQLGEPAALIGYCLGGTMAIAAANLIACERLVTLAAPWRFSDYPDRSRAALLGMWRTADPSAQALGALPMEVLQAAFWSLDPERTVRKFADFGRLAPDAPQASRFVALEDWANEGEPLPYAAAEELIRGLFERDEPGRGAWKVGGRAVGADLTVPCLHFTAARDQIAPSATAPAGHQVAIEAGHVGMIVGSARHQLHDALNRFLAGCR